MVALRQIPPRVNPGGTGVPAGLPLGGGGSVTNVVEQITQVNTSISLVGGSGGAANNNAALIGIFNVRAPPYNAAGDGVTDDTTAIQNALADALTNKGAVLIPGGRYLVNGTMLVKGQRVIGQGAFSNVAHTGPGTLVFAGSNFGPVFQFTANGHGTLEHIAVEGWNASNATGDAIFIDNTAGNNVLFDVSLKYGRYCLNNQSGDNFFLDVKATNAFLALCYTKAGSYWKRCQFDQGQSNIGISQNSLPLWTATTSYTTIGQAVRTGAASGAGTLVLRLTAAGTSGSTVPAPSPWSYNTTITDGTAQWFVDQPWLNTFASIYIDQGAFEVHCEQCDLSGSFNSSYLASGVNNFSPGAVFFEDCDLSALQVPANINSGGSLHFTECEFTILVTTGSGTSAILLQNSWQGPCTLMGCEVTGIFGAAFGLSVNAGKTTKVIGCDFSGGGTGISIAASVTDVVMIGNGFAPPGQTACSTALNIGNSCSYVDFIGNDLNGVTPGPLVVGGSSLQNCFARDNLGYNPIGAVALTPGASPWTYQAGISPESIRMHTTGSISSITQNGGQMLPSGISPTDFAMELSGSDTMVTTYTGTLTVSRYGH